MGCFGIWGWEVPDYIKTRSKGRDTESFDMTV